MKNFLCPIPLKKVPLDLPRVLTVHMNQDCDHVDGDNNSDNDDDDDGNDDGGDDDDDDDDDDL